MKPAHAWIAIAVPLALQVTPAAHGQTERAGAEVRCEPAGKHLVFDCTVRLTNRRTGAPLEGARITVNAEMPSMPMAHHLRPVQAEPAAEPGIHRLRIALEMPGVWALRLDVSGPLRDVLVVRLEFRPGPEEPPVTAAEPQGHGDDERADRGAAHGQQRQSQ